VALGETTKEMKMRRRRRRRRFESEIQELA
jgi:hypothetical protein